MSELATQNELLTGIQETLAEILDVLLVSYDALTGNNNLAVANGAPQTRAANPDAVKTIIVNTGANEVKIFEGGALMTILASKGTWVSPTQGAGAIEVTVGAALASSTIALTTFTK